MSEENPKTKRQDFSSEEKINHHITIYLSTIFGIQHKLQTLVYLLYKFPLVIFLINIKFTNLPLTSGN